MAKYDFVSADVTVVFEDAALSEKLAPLLWGDRVEVVTNGTPARVRARGAEGYVDPGDLGGTALLEVDFIDVGQGGAHPQAVRGFRHRSPWTTVGDGR